MKTLGFILAMASFAGSGYLLWAKFPLWSPKFAWIDSLPKPIDYAAAIAGGILVLILPFILATAVGAIFGLQYNEIFPASSD